MAILPNPKFTDDIQHVVEVMKNGDNWLIVTHERPDGDAIGSALAIAHILEQLGKKWTFLTETVLPRRFDYLEFFGRAQLASHFAGERFSHVIAVDCADEMRFQGLHGWIANQATIVNIDHHRTNPRYGMANYVDADAAATCELIFYLAQQLQQPMQQSLAAALYTGILTDTAGFIQPNTTKAVHQIAAELLAAGVQPYDIAEPALESRSAAQMHLLQMALANLTVSRNGLYAAIYVTRGMLDGAGANDDDVEGLVGFARSIDTVEVGMLFRETEEGTVKVSLRSKRRVDVSRVAQQFGGGGHVRAAGCVIMDTLDIAMDKVSAAIEAALAEAGLA